MNLKLSCQLVRLYCVIRTYFLVDKKKKLFGENLKQEKVDIFKLDKGFFIPSDSLSYNDMKISGIDKSSTGIFFLINFLNIEIKSKASLYMKKKIL